MKKTGRAVKVMLAILGMALILILAEKAVLYFVPALAEYREILDKVMVFLSGGLGYGIARFYPKP